jgi:hypothetical protein
MMLVGLKFRKFIRDLLIKNTRSLASLVVQKSETLRGLRSSVIISNSGHSTSTSLVLVHMPLSSMSMVTSTVGVSHMLPSILVLITLVPITLRTSSRQVNSELLQLEGTSEMK